MEDTASTFEPEIIFPADPYAASAMYLGVMAYPEVGAGLATGRGFEFANALCKFQLWATKKVKGQPFLREGLKNPYFKAPKMREFAGAIERGRRRIFRRMAAFELFGTQLINGFFNVRALGARAIQEGREAEAFYLIGEGKAGPARPELWEKGTPSVRKVLRSNPDRWSEKFALNRTGNTADADQKAKDLKRRGFETSIPVLHMAHGLNEAFKMVEGKINGWGERDSIPALQMNAIDAAERWRLAAGLLPGFPYLSADRMVTLKRS